MRSAQTSEDIWAIMKKFIKYKTICLFYNSNYNNKL